MVESMPSLTVAFLPEEAAVELTSDCGLGGTRRVACKGNTVSREATEINLAKHFARKYFLDKRVVGSNMAGCCSWCAPSTSPY